MVRALAAGALGHAAGRAAGACGDARRAGPGSGAGGRAGGSRRRPGAARGGGSLRESDPRARESRGRGRARASMTQDPGGDLIVLAAGREDAAPTSSGAALGAAAAGPGCLLRLPRFVPAKQFRSFQPQDRSRSPSAAPAGLFASRNQMLTLLPAPRPSLPKTLALLSACVQGFLLTAREVRRRSYGNPMECLNQAQAGCVQGQHLSGCAIFHVHSKWNLVLFTFIYLFFYSGEGF